MRTQAPQLVVTRAGLQANTRADRVAFAQAHPGRLKAMAVTSASRLAARACGQNRAAAIGSVTVPTLLSSTDSDERRPGRGWAQRSR
jgi:hypothetical protein